MTVIARQCVKSSTFQFQLSFILDNYQCDKKEKSTKSCFVSLKCGIIKKKRQTVRCGCQAVGVRRQANKENNSTRR